MYQKTRIALDWIAVICVYSFTLLIIPISNRILGRLNADTVDAIFNLVIDTVVASVFIFLLAYLIKKGRQAAIFSYLWLFIFFMATAYFLRQVEVTTARLHFLGYGILSLFLYRALRHRIGTRMIYIWSGIFIMLFALLDEVLQIPGVGGRSFEFKDIATDWLSGLMGQALIALVVRPRLEAVEIKIRSYTKALKILKQYRHPKVG